MIILKVRTDGTVTAQFDLDEPEHAEIVRAFGTDTLPVPYYLQGTAVHDATVRTRIKRHIQSLNPCSLVAWD